ncbi:atp-dependent rna helicase [Musa troglodytarum]|uniref:Atp-dependent rna helicase n=1 Tax=Musa troglodytarum TaxID=320322 RepID=A0A9E7G5H1_9LILI|nr:atp-dependent rna helicase [Musa troglodytarum]
MVITSIVQSLLPSYLPRWGLRSMWELAAVLNFHHVPGFGNDLSSGNPSSYSHCARAFKLGYSTLQQVKIGGTVYYSKEMISWNGYSNGHLPQSSSDTASTIFAITNCLPQLHGLRTDAFVEGRGKHSTLAKKGLVIINMGFLIGKDDPTVGHPLYCEIRQVEVKKVKATGSKRQCSAVNVVRRSVIGRPDVSTNGKSNGCWHNNDTRCSKSNYYEEINIKHQDEPLDHRHDAKLSERMFTHVPILIEKIVPYRDHLNSTDIR